MNEEQLIEYAKEQEEHLAIERGDLADSLRGDLMDELSGRKTMGEVLDASDIKDLKDKDFRELKDADVYFVVDRDADPKNQQYNLIRLGSKLGKPLEYNFNIMTKEASVFKMYALIGMASLYGYTVKVQKDYKNGSVPRGILVVCEAGDDLTEVACTLQGLPSMGCS